MEWVVKLEAKNGWGEVEVIEFGRLKRRVVGLAADEVGLTLAEGKELLGELARLILQTRMEEFTTCARVCCECLKLRRLRDGRTRKVQTLFGTITVTAPRITVCPCRNDWGYVDISSSSLAELLPDRCTPSSGSYRRNSAPGIPIGRPPRRFALAPKGAESPLTALRRALREQGWQPGPPVTVISDGEAAPPGLVRTATGEPMTCILDWWHISMRVQHIEQALSGIDALGPEHQAGLEIVAWRIGRLRHLIWNGYHEEARGELFGLRHLASEVAYLNGEKFRPLAARFLWNCDGLRRYLTNNADALIDYGARYRSKLPISTSRAEGCVDEIANARMAKKQRMRWSPQGAHRIATVCAAMQDRRFGSAELPLAA